MAHFTARLKLLCLVILSVFYTQFSSATSLPSYQASYTIQYDGVKIGTSTVMLKAMQNDQYALSVNNQPTIPLFSGNVLESSTGLWAHSTIIPLRYFYNYHYFNHQRLIELLFNWRSHKIITRVNGSPWMMPITNGIQDKLSYELQLRQDLIAGKKRFLYPVADGGIIKNYQFQIIGYEILNTPLGNLNTIKIIRLPIPGKENVTLWLAKQLDYQIVRVEQTKNIIDQGVAEIKTYKKIDK